MTARAPACARWRVLLAGHCRRLGGLAAGLLLAAAPPALAVEMPELKAAVVYNLLQFAEWPSEALPPDQAVLHLCIDAAVTQAEPLLLLAGRPVAHRRLEVRRVPASPEGLRACNAWYRESAAAITASAVARAVQRNAVLTICSGDWREDAGAALYLVEANGRLSFDVDNAVVRRLGLQLSSKVLRLARKVHE